MIILLFAHTHSLSLSFSLSLPSFILQFRNNSQLNAVNQFIRYIARFVQAKVADAADFAAELDQVKEASLIEAQYLEAEVLSHLHQSP